MHLLGIPISSPTRSAEYRGPGQQRDAGTPRGPKSTIIYRILAGTAGAKNCACPPGHATQRRVLQGHAGAGGEPERQGAECHAYRLNALREDQKTAVRTLVLVSHGDVPGGLPANLPPSAATRKAGAATGRRGGRPASSRPGRTRAISRCPTGPKIDLWAFVAFQRVLDLRFSRSDLTEVSV